MTPVPLATLIHVERGLRVVKLLYPDGSEKFDVHVFNNANQYVTTFTTRSGLVAALLVGASA